ncbi:MAG: asparagine synthase (glutamine-hydrolyzing) [Chitinophagales bacterium]
MCGITGLVNFDKKLNISESLLRNMAQPLNYRGPDQEGFEVCTDLNYELGFAHKRLSIIDLSESGKQPMYSYSKKSLIVFNGEIYNYQEIRQELVSKGCLFNSNSDTEVILNAYEIYGIEQTLERLEGMFAFTLFDKEKELCFLARDRFGEKPLYYNKNGNCISFSSDIRSFNHLEITKTINLHALAYYFTEMCTPIEHSIWNEVQKLAPAQYITFSKTEFKLKQYWTQSFLQKSSISLKEAIDISEEHIENAVASRLVSDVPVGCFLSGGLDSSLVSLYAAKRYSGKLLTFSVGFEYEKFNELPYAKKVADKIDSEHHEIILNAKDIHVIDALLEEYGEPFADSSQIPTYYVSKFAAQHVKVVLGGDGGDEIFAGYGTHTQAKRMQAWSNHNYLLPFLKLANNIKESEKLKYLIGVMQKDPKVLGSALYRSIGYNSLELASLAPDLPNLLQFAQEENTKAISNALKVSNNVFDSILNASIRTRMVNDYFVKTDRASMFNSIELRTPLVAKELVEFVSSLPYSYLMKDNENKYLLKKIAEKHFDHDFIYRKKQGFSIPLGQWMRHDLKEHFKEVIFEKQEILPLNYNFIQEIYNQHMSGEKDNSHKLWIIYVLHKWLKRTSS